MFISNQLIATIGVLVAGITFGVHDWNRIFHHTVSSPTLLEVRDARLVFIITLLASYGIPLAVSFFTSPKHGRPRWPIYEGITLVTGILLGLGVMIFIDLPSLPPWPIFNYISWDSIGSFLIYASALLAYLFALRKGITSIQDRSWGKIVANIVVICSAAIVVYIISTVEVYYE